MIFPKQSEIESVYGKLDLGRNGHPSPRWESRALTEVRLPYRMRLAWNKDVLINRVRCHRLVAKSLGECLGKIFAHYGSEEKVSAAGMDLFGGAYQFRRSAGLTALSMHAYGIAIDLDPEANPLGKKHGLGCGMIDPAVVDIFESAGWSWGGRTKRAEASHFQAASF